MKKLKVLKIIGERNLRQKERCYVTGGRPTTVSEMARGVRNGVNLIRYANDCIDLKYFQGSSDNFVVVHYNDQHSSINLHNAITVTDKFNQYFNVIHDFWKDL